MCDPVSIISGITAVIGVGEKLMGSSKQSDAAQKINEDQKKELELRRQQMELDAAQKQRQLLRQARIAQAAALSAGVNQTGNAQGSSIQGGLSAISANYGQSSGNVSRGLQIGEQYTTAQTDYANASLKYQEGFAQNQLGSDIFSMSPQVGKLGGFAWGQIKSW